MDGESLPGGAWSGRIGNGGLLSMRLTCASFMAAVFGLVAVQTAYAADMPTKARGAYPVSPVNWTGLLRWRKRWGRAGLVKIAP